MAAPDDDDLNDEQNITDEPGDTVMGPEEPLEAEIVEDEDAAPATFRGDLIKMKHEQKIRRWTLVIVAALIAFSIGATLLAADLASSDAKAQVAGDIAKLSVPTLLALLGGAVAWAYRRNGD